MANLRANNLTGTGGRNAIDGSIFLQSDPKTRISVTNTTGLDFGTDQFTIEFWIYLLKEAPVNKNIFARSTSNSGTTGMIMWFDSNGHLEFDSAHGVSGAVHTGASISTHTWHHIAVTRDSSNNTRLYLNGVNKASASSDTTDIVGATNLQIASNIAGDGYYNDAYISNFRMVKGTAVYSGTTDFTPPTEKLTVIDGTILLCCQDSDNALQEATGKTITGYGRYTNTDTELVTNHSFNNGTTGWTLSDASEGSMAVVNGSLVLTNDDSSDPPVYAWQAVTTVVGQTYDLKVHFSGGTGTPGSNLAIYLNTSSSFGSSAGGSMTADSVSGNGIKIHRFKATVATTYLILRVNANAAGTSIFSAASMKASDPGKASKVLPPVGIDEGVVVDGYTKINSPGVMYFPTGDTSQRGRGRGLFAGGYCPNNTEVIQYIEIQSMSNTIDFGDLSNKYRGVAGFGSKTRGVFSGGSGGSPTGSTLTNTMEYVTISNTANALDFGDMVSAARNVDGCSNSTRGILFGGQLPSSKQNIIQYSTIATTGNTTDFGDVAREDSNGTAFASSTRACVAGGFNWSGVADNVIEYITIATTGNAADFGDLLGLYAQQASVASSTRGVVCTGSIGPTPTNNSNVIQYVTIASTGDSVDFGDYVTVGENVRGVTNSLRGVFAGGYCPNFVNTMNYITIATTGNSSDFGDILNGQTSPNTGMSQAGNTSDSHGGLS